MLSGLHLLPVMLGEDVFFAESNAAKTRLCGPAHATALCEVVNSAFVIDPVGLLESLRNRTGLSFEGVASFAFHHEFPDETPPGHVSVDYFETEQVVPESQFFMAALTVIMARLEIAPEQPLERAFRACVRALRWRRSVRHASWMTRSFTASMGMTIYDDFSKSLTYGHAIAEILSDGTQGRLVVTAQGFSRTLVDLFARSALLLSDSAAAAPGIDPGVVQLAPFTQKALTKIISTDLGSHQLRGVWVDY